MKICLFLLSLCINLLGQSDETDYSFSGKHYVASYLGCDYQALIDLEALKKAFIQAVIECGATVLDVIDYSFSQNGYTMVVLLSESHASIHTYPEHNACFIDLFTCGQSVIVQNLKYL